MGMRDFKSEHLEIFVGDSVTYIHLKDKFNVSILKIPNSECRDLSVFLGRHFFMEKDPRK